MITAIIVYIISLIGMYIWLRIAYSPKGKWYANSATSSDVFVMVFPAVNTMFLIISLFHTPYARTKFKRKSNWLNKLFGIKH